MRREMDLLTDRYKQIAKIVKGDPSDFKPARRFIDTMLSSMDRITNQSVQIYNSPEITEDGRKALDKARESLVLLRTAADNQIAKFNDNNILELDVELEVLKKSLASRGLLDENIENFDDSKGDQNEQ
jgi:5-bromo-4-chloroindolyl phosphate hydrolysis protein